MTLSWQNAKAADGPALYRWLEVRGELDRARFVGQRAILRWERGGQAKFEAVDRVLTALGRHVSELPDDIWREYDPWHWQREAA